MNSQMDGYFTDASMLRRVHRERAMLLMGGRALLMQAAHPVAVSGLVAHSATPDEPYDRLARTAEVMHTIAFGSKEDADRLTAHVRAMHARVRGKTREAVGPFPAGTRYAADDPELLMWVLYTLVDSGIVVYEKYVGRLNRAERAAYWEDYKVIGRLFGLPGADMPDSYADLEAYAAEMYASGKLVVSEWSRTRAKEIVFAPPVPFLARPLIEALNFVTIGLLPDAIRRQYGFFPLPGSLREVAVAAGAEYVKRAVIPLLPEFVRLVPEARAA